jgi:toxin YhaV
LAEIPLNPGHANYNLGNTLGSDYRHWRRDKFGRYRLFFRYLIKPKPDATEDKIIVYV